MKKNYYTLQVVTSLDLAGLLAAVPTKHNEHYIVIENAGQRPPPKDNKRGRPQGAGTNRYMKTAEAFPLPTVPAVKEPVDRKAAAARSAAAMQARIDKSVNILVDVLKQFPNLSMEQLCNEMLIRGATNRYNHPWTPKNLWPYYEKAYALLEGQIQLSYVEKPDGASSDELGTS